MTTSASKPRAWLAAVLSHLARNADGLQATIGAACIGAGAHLLWGRGAGLLAFGAVVLFDLVLEKRSAR